MAIWYRMQPAAHTSTFSVYGSFCTNSGLKDVQREEEKGGEWREGGKG